MVCVTQAPRGLLFIDLANDGQAGHRINQNKNN